MTAATYSGVSAFDRRRVEPGDYRRTIRRGAGLSLGTLTVAGGTASAVTLTAVWMIAAAMSAAPHLPGLADAPGGLALNRFDDDFARTKIASLPPAPFSADRAASSPSSNAEHDKGSRLDAFHRVRFPRERFAFTPADEGEREAAALDARSALPQTGATPPSGYVAATFDLFNPAPTLATAGLAPLAAAPASVATAQTPPSRTIASNAVSPARQASAAHAAAPLMLADAEANPALPPVSDAAPAPHSTLTGFLRKLFGRQQMASANPDMTPALGSHTAIYDIEAGVVYLPDGEKLEAHSGLGSMMDDPHYASRKDRGPTPPNVYDLALRQGLFHGVQAIRLNPVNDDKMFGRAGILAHPYMLGPTGQSFGCVSFKDYPRFLKAVENGEVERMVVVPYRGDYQRYAVND
jgi:hypothetical protein